MASVKGTQDLVLLEAQSTSIRCYFDIGIGDANGELLSCHVDESADMVAKPPPHPPTSPDQT